MSDTAKEHNSEDAWEAFRPKDVYAVSFPLNPEEDFMGSPYYPDSNVQVVDVIEDWNLSYFMGASLECIMKYSMGVDPDELHRALWYIWREMHPEYISPEKKEKMIKWGYY